MWHGSHSSRACLQHLHRIHIMYEEELERLISEQLWRKDQAYKDLAQSYVILQMQYIELQEQHNMLLDRINNNGTDEEYD